MLRYAPVMTRFIWGCLLVTLFTAPGLALDPNRALGDYGHQVWLSENGLPQNTVQAITQTHDGYIWIGTQEGLASFDGVKFDIFDKQNTPQLKSNDIRALFEDDSETLWIATSSDLIRRSESGNFETFETNQTSTGNYIGPITGDRHGGVLFVTSGGLLTCQAGKCGLEELSDIVSNSIQNIFVRADGSLLVVTSNGLKLLRAGALTDW